MDTKTPFKIATFGNFTRIDGSSPSFTSSTFINANKVEPGFFADDVWWRGVLDLLIIDKENNLATVIDYKTGKSSQYADTRQLSLMGVGVFKHFPEVEKIKSALMFLVSKELIKEDYNHKKVDSMYEEWGKIIHRIDAAYESNTFNAVPNFGCRWCPVVSCAHNGK